MPDQEAPDSPVTETTVPETTEPAEPEATEPEATEPEATEPEATESKPTELKPTEPKLALPSPAPSAHGFSDLGLIEPVLKALDAVGYESPSPIQARTIPPILAGKDVLGQAQTGTGKTAAFALPLLSRLDPANRDVQVMVLTPTRELAIQVAEAFQRYAAKMRGFSVLPIYGGQAYEGQLRQLRRGVHVVVGTPGRVMDHMRRGTLKLGSLSCLVLDEADEMLRMGFIEDVEWILEQTPSERQIALFSATLPPVIRRIADKHLREPVAITIKVKTTTADTIRQRYWIVSGLHKLDALTRILEVESFDGMIVFVRTKTATVELAEKLTARGFAAVPINGDIAQQQRERTVERFKRGKIDILVATDVAARGLDVERVSHVVNFDIPHDTDSYVHRVGRTGRAGRQGEAILFVAPRERRMLHAIEQATRQPIERMDLPSTEAINDRRVIRFKQKITDTLAEEEWKPFYSLLEQYQQEHNTPALEIAAALAKQLQGDEPLLLQPPPPRRERPERPYEPRRPMPRLEEGMDRYRLEVGHIHGVQPGNIVGAIANEANIQSRRIGRIQIYDDFSTIDLPTGMPQEIFRILQGIWVCGQRLGISNLGQSKQGQGSAPKNFKSNKPKPKDFKSKDFKSKDFKSKGGGKPKDFKPKDFKPKDFKSKDFKSKGSKPKDFEGFGPRKLKSTGDKPSWFKPKPSRPEATESAHGDGEEPIKKKKPRWSKAKKRAHKKKKGKA